MQRRTRTPSHPTGPLPTGWERVLLLLLLRRPPFGKKPKKFPTQPGIEPGTGRAAVRRSSHCAKRHWKKRFKMGAERTRRIVFTKAKAGEPPKPGRWAEHILYGTRNFMN